MTVEHISAAEMEATMLEQIRASARGAIKKEDEDIIEDAAEEYEELVRTDDDIELLMQRPTLSLQQLRGARKMP